MALVLQAEPLEPLEEDELLEAFDDDVAEDCAWPTKTCADRSKNTAPALHKLLQRSRTTHTKCNRS